MAIYKNDKCNHRILDDDRLIAHLHTYWTFASKLECSKNKIGPIQFKDAMPVSYDQNCLHHTFKLY